LESGVDAQAALVRRTKVEMDSGWVKVWDHWPNPRHVKDLEISCHGFILKILGSKN